MNYNHTIYEPCSRNTVINGFNEPGLFCQNSWSEQAIKRFNEIKAVTNEKIIGAGGMRSIAANDCEYKTVLFGERHRLVLR